MFTNVFWEPNKSYHVGSQIHVLGNRSHNKSNFFYQLICTTDHISSEKFSSDSTKWTCTNKELVHVEYIISLIKDLGIDIKYVPVLDGYADANVLASNNSGIYTEIKLTSNPIIDAKLILGEDIGT